MDKNDVHHQITEEIYLEGVRNLLLEYTLGIMNKDFFRRHAEIKEIKKFIHDWVEARYPTKIIEDKD